MNSNKEKLFRQLYNDLKDKIYRLCLGFTGNSDDAKDLFQEIIILVWRNLENFRNESHISTWVYRIATNRAILYVNKKNKSNKLYQDVNVIDLKNLIVSDEAEHKLEEEEKINQLYRAISTLKEIDKIIIGLHLEGCSYSEISEITGLSASNVGVKINRIKKSLITKLNRP